MLNIFECALEERDIVLHSTLFCVKIIIVYTRQKQIWPKWHKFALRTKVNMFTLIDSFNIILYQNDFALANETYIKHKSNFSPSFMGIESKWNLQNVVLQALEMFRRIQK